MAERQPPAPGRVEVGGVSAGWWRLVATLPPIGGSAVLVGIGCALLAGHPALAYLPLLIWAGGALLAVTRPGERLAVRLACGFHRPSPAQATLLAAVTDRVLVAAGLRAGRVDFYLRRGRDLNGFAAGARSVAISEQALGDFAARRHSRVVIEAVLAHELGHLTVPGSRLLPAAAWLAWPWRLFARALMRLGGGMVGLRRLSGPLLLVLAAGVAVAVVQMTGQHHWSGVLGLSLVTVPALGCPLLDAAAARATERAADAFAVCCGYGPALARALTLLGNDRHPRPRWAGLLSDHPDTTRRILSITAAAAVRADVTDGAGGGVSTHL